MVTSTPNLSQEKIPLDESGLSIVEQPPSPPLLLTDSSINETHHECSTRTISQHQSKSGASSIHKNEEVKKIPERDKKRKVIGKEGESNDNGNSILILIEAMECDCEEDDQVDVGVHNDASRDNAVDKGERLAKVTSKLNMEAFIAGQHNEDKSKYRHASLAQITAKRSGENSGNAFRKKGIRAPAVHKNTKKMKRSSVTEAVSQTRLNESLEAHSVAESSASEAARAQLENKLLATMQILKNKEETVLVQAESLALAEARIAALTAKAQQTTQKHHQEQQTPVMDHKIVNTLRDNLSVIEELYRECFYESAKQDELITKLRRSYLDMRRTERQKSEQIGRLQHVVHSQRCSLERCQEIAMEVETLKSEITNFLNSSQSNDSGVWEREDCAADVTEDLRAIADLLRRLRDMLDAGCTCGLEEENMKLKRINETMEIQIGEMRQRVNELEEALQSKDKMEQQYQVQMQEKDRELHQLRGQVVALEAESRAQDNASDGLNCKLKQMEELLKNKSSELESARRQCEAQQATIAELRDQVSRADHMAQESGQVREEVSCLSAQVSQWREQLASTRRRLRALEAELQRARDHCKHLAVHYRDKAQLATELQSQLEEAQSRGAELCGEARRAVCGVRHWLRRQRQKNRDKAQLATELQSQLEEAQSRGAELCGEARRAVCGVRHWLRRQRQKNREHEEKIKQQEMLIQTLQHQGATNPTEHTATNDNEPCCSKHLARVEARRSDRSFVSASEAGCYKCASATVVVRTSESEMASSPAPPTPPRRLLRKKAFCGDIRCQWPQTRESSVQRPTRSDASVGARLSSDQLSSRAATPTREMSPPDELLERVERAHEALADAHRRWARAGPGPT